MRVSHRKGLLLGLGLAVASLGILAVILLGRDPKYPHQADAGSRHSSTTAAAALHEGERREAPFPTTGEAAIVPGRASESPVAAGDPTNDDERPLPATGRVVDERRLPVSGASILLIRAGAPRAQTTSDSDGVFRLTTSSRIEGLYDSLCFFAADTQGRCVSAVATISERLFRPGNLELVDTGALVLRAGAPLTVRVRDAKGSAIADAVVKVECGLARIDGPELKSDAAGSVRFNVLPLGESAIRVRAQLGGVGSKIVTIVPGGANEAEVILGPGRDIDVLVTDLEGAPIAGAHVSVTLTATSVGDELNGFVHHWRSGHRLDLPIPPTAGDGRTRIAALESDLDGWLSVSKEGFESSHSRELHSQVALTPELRDVHLALQSPAPIELRWHVAAGAVPTPADGSEIGLLHVRGGWDSALPPPTRGRMEGGDLIVASFVAGGRLCAWAVAPDGAIAMLFDPRFNPADATTEFESPRRLTVFVRDVVGGHVAGAFVTANVEGRNRERFEGNELVERTDQDGRATFFPLLAEPRTVSAKRNETAAAHTFLGKVDLRSGDVELQGVLPDSFEAILAVRIDGEPRLPARFNVGADTPLAGATREDPQRGELHLLLPVRATWPQHVLWLEAEGFSRATATIVEHSGGESDRPPSATIELARGGTLLARVIPRSDKPARPHLERWEESSGGFMEAPSITSRIPSPNVGVDGYEFTALPAGRYRIAEELERGGGSGGNPYLASEPVDVVAGGTASVVLDLSRMRPITVRVEVPDGEDRRNARVVPIDTGGRTTLSVRSESVAMPGLEISRDGTIELLVDDAHPLRVRAWHPWLVPAADGGEVELGRGTKEATLRLELGPQVTFAAPSVVAGQYHFVRVLLFDPSDHEAPIASYFAVGTDEVPCHFAPPPVGTFDLWFDSANFALAWRRNVRFDGSALDLGAIDWRRGSTIRFVAPAGTSGAPRLSISATSRERPTCVRRAWPGDDGELPTIHGLGAGTFDVQVYVQDVGAITDRRSVTVDGLTDVDLPLTLR